MKYRLRYVILTLAIILLVWGLVTGDMEEGILRKAINLCYECIGIG